MTKYLYWFTNEEIQYLLESVEMDIGSGKIPPEEVEHAKSAYAKLSSRQRLGRITKLPHMTAQQTEKLRLIIGEPVLPDRHFDCKINLVEFAKEVNKIKDK